MAGPGIAEIAAYIFTQAWRKGEHIHKPSVQGDARRPIVLYDDGLIHPSFINVDVLEAYFDTLYDALGSAAAILALDLWVEKAGDAMTGSLGMPNNVAITWKDTGGTDRTVILMSSADSVHIFNNSNGNGGPIIFNSETGGGESARFDANGRLGIDQTAPLAPLHIGAGTDTPVSGSVAAYFTNNGVTNVAVRNATDNVEVSLGVSTSRGSVGTRTNHDLQFNVNNAQAALLSAAGVLTLNGINVGEDTLSVFDEGTWTPALAMTVLAPVTLTYSSRYGKYQRVNSEYTIQAEMVVGTSGDGSGILTFSLPATSHATGVQIIAAMWDDTPAMMRIPASSGVGYIYTIAEGQLQESDLGVGPTSDTFRFSGTYFAA